MNGVEITYNGSSRWIDMTGGADTSVTQLTISGDISNGIASSPTISCSGSGVFVDIASGRLAMNNINIVGAGASQRIAVTGSSDVMISDCYIYASGTFAIGISNAITSTVYIKDSIIWGVNSSGGAITTGAGTGTATPNLLVLDNCQVINSSTSHVISAATGGANNGDLRIQMNATLLWANSGSSVKSINVTSGSAGEIYLEPLGRVTSNADIPTASTATLINRTLGDIDCNLSISNPIP
jgi:hypothetical protein